jgi:hypothetical protein
MAPPATVLPITPDAAEPRFAGEVGAFRVEVHGDARKGTITLSPESGAGVRIIIQGDTLTMQWDGPKVRLEAPAADMTLAARNLHLQIEESFTVEARREVDIHAGVDVEIRADHHVNLWGHGVLVGD